MTPDTFCLAFKQIKLSCAMADLAFYTSDKKKIFRVNTTLNFGCSWAVVAMNSWLCL